MVKNVNEKVKLKSVSVKVLNVYFESDQQKSSPVEKGKCVKMIRRLCLVTLCVYLFPILLVGNMEVRLKTLTVITTARV